MEVAERHEWFEYPIAEPDSPLWDPAYAGFRVRVRISASFAERRAETERYLASAGPNVELQDAYWQHVAPWVIDWNLCRRDSAGALVSVPAPGAPGGSWERFLDLEPELLRWVQSVVHFGYDPAWRDALQNRRRPFPIVTWPPRPEIDEEIDLTNPNTPPAC